MKAKNTLMVAALAAAGLLVAVDTQAQSRGGSRGHGAHGGAHHGGGHFRGNHGGHHGGRHWGGHYRSHWGPRLGFYIGAPLLIGGFGYPYYNDYYYPRSTVIYREVERAPYYEQPGELVPSTEVPRSEGAPSQAPLYQNYCDSARAYYPKVTSCPEGWKLARPVQ